MKDARWSRHKRSATNSGTTTYNLFVEPQCSIADEGAEWPKWQVFVGFNMVLK